MAHDKTPERNNLILFYGVLSVVTLVSLGFVLRSYFTTQSEREESLQIAKTPIAKRDAIKAAQLKQLESGPVPIEQAMQELAAHGRDGIPLIKPEPSNNTGALEGWANLRLKPVVPQDVAAAAEAAAQHGGALPDGGVAPSGNKLDTQASPGGSAGPKPSPTPAPAPTGPQK